MADRIVHRTTVSPDTGPINLQRHFKAVTRGNRGIKPPFGLSSLKGVLGKVLFPPFPHAWRLKQRYFAKCENLDSFSSSSYLVCNQTPDIDPKLLHFCHLFMYGADLRYFFPSLFNPGTRFGLQILLKPYVLFASDLK